MLIIVVIVVAVVVIALAYHCDQYTQAIVVTVAFGILIIY